MRHYLLPALCVLTGCVGSLAPNSDIVGGKRLNAADTAPVTVTASGPAIGEGGRRVFGTSCKNLLWDPSPSKDSAIALMKAQAFQLGYNAVHSVDASGVGPGALAINCWSAISATGIAYKLAVAVPAD